jgi:two-component system, OmpR family, sensor histidine kinase VicK
MFGLAKKNTKGAKGQTALAANLRDEQRKSEIILNAIEDGVVLFDANKTIQLFNPGAAKITGWSADEAVGLDYHSVIKLVDDKDVVHDEATHPFNRVFEENTTVRDNTATLLSQTNQHISLSLSVSPLHDESGKITAAVAIFRDVSEERKEERQRAEFISTASHEMRTPVAAIEGYLALALNERVSKIDSKARSYLEKAHESTQHLGKLFQDLLTSAKAEDGRLVSHPVVVEMGTYLEQLSDSFRFAAQKKGLLADFIIGATPPEAGGIPGTQRVVKPLYYVHVDPDRLREVITNLFDNAVKYTPSGKISLGLTGNTDVVQLFVRDTGPGIPATDIPHLFQKFYRVDTSATRTIGGTGLGLFICRKIVELYQGRIWVESEPGKGSTFYINLPRLSAAKAEELITKEAQNPTTSPIASLTTPVV